MYLLRTNFFLFFLSVKIQLRSIYFLLSFDQRYRMESCNRNLFLSHPSKITIVEWKNNISSDKKCTRRVMILYICKGESTFHCIDATVYIHIKYIVAYRGVTLFVDSQFRVRVMK